MSETQTLTPPQAAPRVRRNQEEIISAEEAKLLKMEEAVEAQRLKIGGLKESRLSAEKRRAAAETTNKLVEAVQALSPEEVSAILAGVEARKQAALAVAQEQPDATAPVA